MRVGRAALGDPPASRGVSPAASPRSPPVSGGPASSGPRRGEGSCNERGPDRVPRRGKDGVRQRWYPAPQEGPGRSGGVSLLGQSRQPSGDVNGVRGDAEEPGAQQAPGKR